jgi:amino acid adenylation domain-containing protein
MTAEGPAAPAAARSRLAQLGPARLTRSDVFPLSSAQQRLWLADQSQPGPSAYHLTRVIELEGPLDVAALNAALTELVSRHEALRTSMLAVGGQPLQRTTAPAGVELPVIDTTEAAADALATAAARRPLDLTGGPLWRGELHRLHASRHRLVLVWHHIIADGTTVALLLSELAAAYRACHHGQPVDLPPATAHRDYIRWERSFADDPDHARQIGYWEAQLAGCEPLRLPADGLRPAAPRQPAARVPVRVRAATADALRAVARAHGVTLAQIMLAGYAAALHRFSGRADFPIGMPVSLRRDRRWACSAGLYVNTLPIRVSLAGNPPFSDVLRQVRGTVLAALGAADAAPEPAAGSAGPPYDVTFGLVQAEPALALPELSNRVDRVFCARAKFDLHLEIADPGPGADLDGILEYDAELLGQGPAGHLADAIAAVFSATAAAPGCRVGNLPLWPDTPAPAVAAQATSPAPAGPSIDRLFTAAARARPDHVAVIDAADGQELTYNALAARAAAVASALTARGVGRGDFIGIALTRSVEMIVAVLGVLSAGAAYVPLDPGYPARQLTEMISRSGVKLVLGGPLPGQSVAVISPAAAAGTAVPAVAGTARHETTAERDGAGDDPAYVMFTSGSTGPPKAVVVPHRAVLRLVRGEDFAAMADTERWLHAGSPAFDSVILELWAPLLNGGTVVVLPGLPSVARLAEAIRRHGVTSAHLTTGLFNLVVDNDVESLRPLRQLVTGGEAASPGHMRRALQVVGTVVNGYGPTENTMLTTCHPQHDPAEVTSPVPLGRPVNGTTVHIADGYGHPVPAGVTGEILAGGRGLALGYAGQPGLTAERFVPSPCGPPGARLYRTGDYGRLGAGGLVHFASRRDNQVKVRGFRIELGAVELAVMAHPDVEQAAVVVHTDPAGDRRLVGYVVGRAGGPALSAYLADLLPPYMIPGQWISLRELPLGPAGKVDRAALPAAPGDPSPSARPHTVAEELLIAWYAELLGLADATPDTDFFAVGGHSLLASRLAARIRAALGVNVPLSTVFSHSRLADLAAAVAALRRAGLPPLQPGGGGGEWPLSFAQEWVWSRQRRMPASPAYHALLAVDLAGGLDETALAGAVQAVAGRHPMLRAVFGERDGRPYQRILPAGSPVEVPRTDLTTLADGARRAALDQLAAAMLAEPFDLTAAPPLRAALIRTGAGRHRLLLAVHRLVADDWGVAAICRDLAAAYRGELPPAQELSYLDFAVWQRVALAGPAASALTRYWRDQLAGAPTRLELDGGLATPDGPADGPHGPHGPHGPGGRGDGLSQAVPVLVPSGLASSIRRTGRQAGATPFTVLLAAFAVLLSRHTPQRDLVIAAPLAGREDAELTDMVGLFASTLPLRIDASGQPTFTELIHRVRETAVAALQHADLPFEHIAELAGLLEDGAGRPALPVRFAVQAARPSRFALGDVDAEVMPVRPGAAAADLAMSLFDDGQEFSGYLEYRGDRFSPACAAALAAEFTDLLAGLTSEGAGEIPWTTTPSPLS